MNLYNVKGTYHQGDHCDKTFQAFIGAETMGEAVKFAENFHTNMTLYSVKREMVYVVVPDRSFASVTSLKQTK